MDRLPRVVHTLASDSRELESLPRARIAIIDDHTIVRESIAKALGQEADFEIVGSWSSAEQAIAFLESGGSFDLAVVDYRLPGMDGIAATRRMREMRPEIQVIILSMYCREEYILEAFEAGVMAFLPKETSVAELADAIRTVLKGESVLSPRITRQLIEFCQRLKQGDGQTAVPALSQQHVQILRLAGFGYANKEIADRLGLNVNTVKLRLKEAFTRLDARDRTHAVITALRLGLFEIDENGD